MMLIKIDIYLISKFSILNTNTSYLEVILPLFNYNIYEKRMNSNNNTPNYLWLLIYLSIIYFYIRFNIEFSSVVYCDGPYSLDGSSMSASVSN